MSAAGGLQRSELSALAKCNEILESNGYTCKVERGRGATDLSGGQS